MRAHAPSCSGSRRLNVLPSLINRYLQIFTPIEPTVHNISEYNFEKQASKVRDLRPDTLSLMMSHANVRPGGKLLVVEDLHGMVVASAVERMGGTLPLVPSPFSWTTGNP